MKKQIVIIILCMFLCQFVVSQTPLWQGKGRIAISSDGNEHDHDDWAATPLSLALIAAKGLQDRVVLYTYSDHVWGSNQDHPYTGGISAYNHMNESVLGSKYWFGFDKTKFICAVDNQYVAYDGMRDAINGSTAENPLIIIAAGPMQVVGEALNRSEKDKRQFVTVLSHSEWNNKHADKPEKKPWDIHTGWTFKKMQDAFGSPDGGNTNFVQIADQNSGADYLGLFCDRKHYDWILSSEARNNEAYKKGSWDFLYRRLESCIKRKGTCFDPSDAGMIVYLFTGVEKTNPEMVRQIMEHPVRVKNK